MKKLLSFFLASLWINSGEALVGDATNLADANEKPTVMITSDRGNFCTGTVIAPDLILTAAHCVGGDADVKLIDLDARRQPTLRDVVGVVRHPQFDLQAILAHRATADLALLKLSSALGRKVATLSNRQDRIVVGERFAVWGYGVSAPGNGKTAGILRQAVLIATGRPGNLQLRLADPAATNRKAGLGACTGDSGAPVFQNNDPALGVIGVVSWSTGPNQTAGCGGLTGVTPITLYRSWIIDTARKMGSAI